MESGLIILINRGDTATSARPGQTNRGRQIKHSAPRAAANYAHRARTEQLSPVSTRGAATCFESAARGIKLHKYSGNHVMMERRSSADGDTDKISARVRAERRQSRAIVGVTAAECHWSVVVRA